MLLKRLSLLRTASLLNRQLVPNICSQNLWLSFEVDNFPLTCVTRRWQWNFECSHIPSRSAYLHCISFSSSSFIVFGIVVEVLEDSIDSCANCETHLLEDITLFHDLHTRREESIATPSLWGFLMNMAGNCPSFFAEFTSSLLLLCHTTLHTTGCLIVPNTFDKSSVHSLRWPGLYAAVGHVGQTSNDRNH